ncbi:hypothetical protein [Amaricoccus sp.]|uniref:hypothetical protein n=1 Tax=Amaricoccus sp. TaxID=1872485 RepID=UPI001B62250C|nr:hypothetical protein [Amaricoccus sp.]MBP7242939.1 hypothetical protein [Amaricoccus sp.]
MTGVRDSLVTSAQRPEVKLAEAEFALRGLRRDLAAARRLNLGLGVVALVMGALAWAAW